MKVLTFVTAAYPTLLAELDRTPTRDRAERIRVLAQLGLAYERQVQSGAFLGAQAGAVPAMALTPPPPPPPSAEEKRKKLRSKGLASLMGTE